jgi:uncharacterized membrane protein
MPPAGPGARIAAVDALRGVALVGMAIYHCAWDLSFLQLAPIAPGPDPGWRWFAHVVAGTFLALVGVGLVLATRDGFHAKSYLRRLIKVVVAAAIVTIATRVFLPDAYIFFGILHAIAAASVLALPFLVLPVWLVVVAAVLCLALPALSQGFCLPDWLAPGTGCVVFEHPFGLAFLEGPGWLWLGLGLPPSTLDYVPLLPWFALPLAGIAVARLGLMWQPAEWWGGWQPRRRLGRVLAGAGRWSLAVYLIHQPILLAVLYPAAMLLGPNPAVRAATIENACAADCAMEGQSEAACTAICGCAVDGWTSAGLLDRLATITAIDQLTAAEDALRLDVIRQCLPGAAEPMPGDEPDAD